MTDDATAMFMDLVDCEEWEVKDIPADRVGVDCKAEAKASVERHNCNKKLPKNNKSSKKFKFSFGKFKGHDISDVPAWYLKWLAEQQDGNTKAFREAQKAAKAYIRLV